MAYEADRRVVLSQQNLVDRIRRRIMQYASAKWRGLPSYRDEDIEAFIADVVPVVITGQRQVAGLTDAYLDSMFRLAGMTPPEAAAVGAYPRGVDPNSVYRRPAVTAYTALSEGRPLGEAVLLGESRLRSLIAMDMQLARTHQANVRLRGDYRVRGYRRTLSPGENCALCAIASTQRYTREDLMPIHSGCRCEVVPIVGTHDPGQIINPERYDEVMRQLDEQDVDYSRLKDTRFDEAGRLDTVMVRVHGEHGPVLSWRDQNFTGPSDI